MNRSESDEWREYYYRNRLMVYYNALMVKTKFNWLASSKYTRNKIDYDTAQEIIIRNIENSNPFMASRFGCTESRCLGEGFGILYGCRRHYRSITLKTMCNLSGLFPNSEEGANDFFQITSEAIKDIDLLGVWTTEMQDYLVNTKCRSDIKITDIRNLEPFQAQNPWTRALKGKRVVVVHPFKDTIEYQWKRREQLFSNPLVLPRFELRIVKAVQTVAGESDSRFSSWKTALEYMYDECRKQEFDVAIIGCGAYGMPLASLLKKEGKIAIHLGGATQILFGIKGSRWDKNPIHQLYNDYWVRPLVSERPINAKIVENGCYW